MVAYALMAIGMLYGRHEISERQLG